MRTCPAQARVIMLAIEHDERGNELVRTFLGLDGKPV
jgi:hypothetical protein